MIGAASSNTSIASRMSDSEDRVNVVPLCLSVANLPRLCQEARDEVTGEIRHEYLVVCPSNCLAFSSEAAARLARRCYTRTLCGGFGCCNALLVLLCQII